MKALIALLLTFGAYSAQAEDVPVSEVTHEVSSFVGVKTGNNGRIYYECRSLKYDVEKFLADLGATNIDIDCRGGYDPQGITTLATIRGSFTSKVITEGSENFGRYADVTMRGRDNCALVAELFDIFEDNFSITDLAGRGSRISSACRSDRSYRVSLKVVQ